MQEDATRRKQVFLRESILEKGYDSVDFIDYISRERENGDDIDNWSISSLEEIVNKYKRTAPPILSTPLATNFTRDDANDSYEDEDDSKSKRITRQTTQNDQEDDRTQDSIDIKRRVSKIIINRSEAENAALRDFFFVGVPSKKTLKNELNFERRLKVKVSE